MPDSNNLVWRVNERTAQSTLVPDIRKLCFLELLVVEEGQTPSLPVRCFSCTPNVPYRHVLVIVPKCLASSKVSLHMTTVCNPADTLDICFR